MTLPRATFFRMMALPACLLWGVVELIALQRARLHYRRTPS